ncbi:hypothetical protein FKP32DRAFT_1598524 [Trametes sanguinea]|nr:hypothetical protein FKP32DRAFT_1598524 [Trametes sanguinea]
MPIASAICAVIFLRHQHMLPLWLAAVSHLLRRASLIRRLRAALAIIPSTSRHPGIPTASLAIVSAQTSIAECSAQPRIRSLYLVSFPTSWRPSSIPLQS